MTLKIDLRKKIKSLHNITFENEGDRIKHQRIRDF